MHRYFLNDSYAVVIDADFFPFHLAFHFKLRIDVLYRFIICT